MGGRNLMSYKIGLFTNINNHGMMCGCWKVSHNLIVGLKKLGIEVSLNKSEKYNGCLINETLSDSLPKNTLIGPEIMVLPNENSLVWKKWKHWTQPSQWVIDYMRTFNETEGCNLHEWPVGIDTEQFNDSNRGPFKYDCFVYYKNVTHQTPPSKLNFVENGLEQRGMKYKTLIYGNYEEEELIKCTKECKFGIFIIGTESQNIALLEVLSSNVPVYVFDETTFQYNDFSFSNTNVSGAPYFSPECGCKFHELNFDLFDKFVQKIDSYNPRNYIMKNHTLIHGAQKYIDILVKINATN